MKQICVRPAGVLEFASKMNVQLSLGLRARCTLRYCRTTVGQTIQLLWERTDFDSTVRQCLVSDENGGDFLLACDDFGRMFDH